MARLKQSTIDGLALPSSTMDRQRSPQGEPAFRIPVARSLRMHPWLALAVALLALSALVGYALSRKPMYRAESRVYVEPIQTRVLSADGGSGNFDLARYESFLQEQMETVERPDILLAAVKSMPEGVWQQRGESAEAAAARLGTALKTERVSTSYQLSISVAAATPAAAAAAANAVTQAYLEAGQKDAKSLSAGRLELLTQERQRLEDEMEARRAEQRSLGMSLGVANPAGVGGDSYDAELQTMRNELASARQAHDVAAAQLAALRGPGGLHAAGTVASAEEAVAVDPAVSSMRIAINQRRAALIGQMNGMKPANPVYQEDQAELGKLDQQLTSLTTGMQAQVEQRMEAKLRQDLQRTGDLQSRLAAEVSRDTTLATSAGPKLQRAAELTADLARLQARFTIVDDSVRSLQLETSGPGMAHLALAASVPAAPEPSKSRLALFLAFPLALVLGVGAAVLRMKFDSRVYTPGDVEDALGFSPLGLLPASDEVSTAVMEEYLLRLAAGMEAAYRDAAVRTFVFTAASATTEIGGEVEAARRKLGELGFRATVLSAEEAMLHSGSTEGGGHMPSPLERVKLDFELVLIDTHPILHSALAEYAVRSSDAVILVIESGVTTRQELAQAGHLLQRLQASGVGALLQGMTLRNSGPHFRQSIEILEKRGAGSKKATGTAPAEAKRLSPLLPEARSTEKDDAGNQDVVNPVSTSTGSADPVAESDRLQDESPAQPSETSETIADDRMAAANGVDGSSAFAPEAAPASVPEPAIQIPEIDATSHEQGGEPGVEPMPLYEPSTPGRNGSRSSVTSIRRSEAELEWLYLEPLETGESLPVASSGPQDEVARFDDAAEGEAQKREALPEVLVMARKAPKSWAVRDEQILPTVSVRGPGQDVSASAVRRSASRQWAALTRLTPIEDEEVEPSMAASAPRFGQRG